MSTSKYKTHAAKGTLTVGPSPQNQTGGGGINLRSKVESEAIERAASQGVPFAILPRTHFASSEKLRVIVQDLRAIKSQKLYLSEGAPSFRQWAQSLYGERLGIWLDEML